MRGAFAGALALNAHGIARSTADVDFLVHPEHRARLLESLAGSTSVVQEYDTMIVLEHRQTKVEIDVLVAFDAISLEACTEPERTRVAGRWVPVVSATSLAAMKTVAAVDSPAIEAKQRADLEAMVRGKVIDRSKDDLFNGMAHIDRHLMSTLNSPHSSSDTQALGISSRAD